MPSTPKILVVDDEPRAVTLLRNVLTPEGYNVLTAHSGAEAIEVATRDVPDVLLLDVMMPELNGYEVCARLRADPRLAHLPIIMLTALDDRDAKLEGLQAGADDFLSKPFDATELRARLRTITRLNRFRQMYEERARLEAAIAHAPHGIVLAQADGEILQRNRGFIRLLAPDQVGVSNFFACLPSEVAARLQADLAASPNGVKSFETPLARPLNPATVVEISCARVPWQGRTIMHFMIRDLTDQKVLEHQLHHSQRIELLGQLAGSAIHDLNNLLAAIAGNAQLLQLTNGTDLKVHLDQINTCTQRGSTMLRQLLMFARGEDGTLVSANLAGVAAEVAHMIKETFGRAYSTDFHAADNLPQVLVDETQVHQIVMNLCVNARDAMPNGGKIVIDIARREVTGPVDAVMGDKPAPGSYVAISVRDHGTGIPPEVLPKLFDPFFTTKPKGKGTGLGLATVIRLVHRHHGFVTLETAVGQGTCFTCCFPVDPASPVPAA